MAGEAGLYIILWLIDSLCGEFYILKDTVLESRDCHMTDYQRVSR